MSGLDKKAITEAKLEQALERLVQGIPERTKPDGKISISRINSEAGLSSGSVYYYKNFLKKARSVISDIKSKQNSSSNAVSQSTLAKLRAERDKEKELKVKYRNQRDSIKKFADCFVQENAKLNFSLYEALSRIDQLENELSSHKVTSISKAYK